MCRFTRNAILVGVAMLACGAIAPQARAQISASMSVLPRQLTLPPHVDEALSDNDQDDANIDGAVSVLPDRRNCASDVMIIARPLAGAETPKLKSAVAQHTGNTPGCRITTADTNPAPVLTMPPHGVKAPVPTYTATAQVAEASEASRP